MLPSPRAQTLLTDQVQTQSKTCVSNCVAVTTGNHLFLSREGKTALK